MKRSIALLISSGLAVGAAHAQSSVVLFGAVDTSVRYISYSGKGSAVTMGSFGNSPSMIGFLGTEDLGGGLQAVFRLEAAYVPATGQSATGAFGLPFFNRSSWVGLKSSKYGEVHLGRDWNPAYVNLYLFDPTYNLGVGNLVHYSNLLNQGLVPNYYWNSNAITYYTPSNMGGFSGIFQVSVRGDGTGCNGNVVCTTTIGTYVGGRLAYEAGPLTISAALAQTGISSNTRATSPTGKWTQANVGMAYDFGIAKVLLSLNTDKFINLRETRGSIAAQIPIGGDYAWISYEGSRVDSSAQAAGVYGAQGGGMGFVHNLSKRTAVYASLAYLKNRGKGTLSVEDVGSYSTNTPPGGVTTGCEIGLRHTF